jgi:flagellar biosynthesis chaperone FliJ
MKLYNIYTHKHDKKQIMNITEVRNVIRQAIAEAKAEGGLKKSNGKLVDLKNELKGLKGMREALGQYQIAEGGESTPGFVAEYAHMQRFVNELEKIKEAHARLAEMLDNQISAVEGKVSFETNKIKEMMGLIEKAKKPAAKKDDKKTAKKDDKKEEPKEEKPKADDKKKGKELDEASYKVSPNAISAQNLKKGDIITSGEEVVSVSAGAKTPSGKVEVTLTKDGKTRTAIWGKSTKVGVKK